jgi:hypothetical protein
MVELKEGWGFPGKSNKAHYFIEGRSLCRKWGFYLGELEQGKDESPDNCAECKRALTKRKLKTFTEAEFESLVDKASQPLEPERKPDAKEAETSESQTSGDCSEKNTH